MREVGNRLFAASVSPLTANDARSNGATDHLAPGPLMGWPVVDHRGLRLVDYPRFVERFCDEICEHGRAFTVKADTSSGDGHHERGRLAEARASQPGVFGAVPPGRNAHTSSGVAGGLAAELRKILQKLGLAEIVRVEWSGIGVPAAHF